ncbi:hypothetical protein LTR17_016151 [Elasticomyces elasticus]|nr:hypothetical protein LTR17_016151 [Elasticomyces elasticus]
MPISRLLEERWKDLLHYIQIGVTSLAIILSIGRLAIRNPPASRGNVLSISMGIKSLIIIAYQLLSERKQRFRRWHSLKAFAILNTMEVVFWLTVVVVSGMGASRTCGMSTNACSIGVLVILSAIVSMGLSAWVAGISIILFRRSKTQRATTTTEHSQVTERPPRYHFDSVPSNGAREYRAREVV